MKCGSEGPFREVVTPILPTKEDRARSDDRIRLMLAFAGRPGPDRDS